MQKQNQKDDGRSTKNAVCNKFKFGLNEIKHIYTIEEYLVNGQMLNALSYVSLIKYRFVIKIKY